MKRMTVEEFHAALKAQGVPNQEHFAFVCPMCETIQSARSLIRANAGKTFEDVEKLLAYSCVGRFTGAASPRKEPDGKPCNWTLGGLLRVHKFEVTTPDGKHHPRFELASPEQAQELAAKHAQAEHEEPKVVSHG